MDIGDLGSATTTSLCSLGIVTGFYETINMGVSLPVFVGYLNSPELCRVKGLYLTGEGFFFESTILDVFYSPSLN